MDAGLFYGSDEFLRLAGFDPNALTKRLGDAYFEDRLVRDQLFRLTGKRFLDGYVTDLEQLKALYANALVEQRTLNLSPGVALSAAQVAALTRDIVWMEPVVVNGETVLAPRVYLAASRPQNFDVASARIVGRDVAIDAERVVNSGAIVARDDLTLRAKSEIANVGGLLGAGGTVGVVTPGTFGNLSGEVSGTRVAITAGDIVNSTVVTRDGTATTYQDRLNQTARIVATDDVTLTARGDILSEGGQIRAGGDIVAAAGGSIVLQAVAAEMARDDRGKGWFDRESGVAHTPGRLDAGGNIVLDAGQNIGLAGIAVTAGGNVDLMAAKDITIAAVTDTHEREAEAKGKGGALFGSKWSLAQQSQSATAIASALDAGGRIGIAAGAGDIAVTGSDLSAGKDIALTAGRSVAISAAEETSSKSRNESSKGFLSKSQARDKEAIVAHRGSSLAADGDISVTAKAGDAKVSGSGISSAGDVAISATGDVRLDAVEDTYTSYSYRKNSGVFAESFFGEGGAGVTVGYRSEKTERGASQSSHKVSSILADGDIAIASGRDLVSQAADARAGGDIDLTAGRDVDLQAVYNRDDFFERHKSKQIGLTAALNENITPALRSLQAAAEMPGNAYGGRGAKTIATVSAGLKAVDTVDRLTTGPLLSAGLTLGVSSSSSSAEGQSSTAHVGTLAAGGDIAVTAGRDIGVEGTKVTADDDIALTAGRDLTIQSAQSTASESSKNKSSSASVGVSVGVGAGGVSATASGSVSTSKGSSSAQSTTHTNAEIVAGGDVALKAGQDTTIAGAKVEGDTVAVDTGRNLTVASRQDTATRSSRQDGVSVGVNAGLGGGGVSGNVNVERGRGQGDKAWVEQQTTIRGRDGVDIKTGEHTQVDGALVTSPDGKVAIDTGTFGHSDIQDHDTSKDTSVNVGVSAPLSGAGANGPNGENGGLDGTIEGSFADKDKQGSTRATVTDGSITTRDADGQKALEASGKTEQVAALNRDETLAQQVTKDEATGFQFYASDTSVKKAAEAVETIKNAAQRAIDALVDSGNLSGESGGKVKDVLKKLEEVDPETLTLCSGGGRQGFNLYELFVGTAHAAGGCVLRFEGGSQELSPQEYDALKNSVLQSAAQAIRSQLPIVQELLAKRETGTLTNLEAERLADAYGALQQQMAYFELCSDNTGSLRASGLIPSGGLYSGMLSVAEAFRIGGDKLAAKSGVAGANGWATYQKGVGESVEDLRAIFKQERPDDIGRYLDAAISVASVQALQLEGLTATQRHDALVQLGRGLATSYAALAEPLVSAGGFATDAGRQANYQAAYLTYYVDQVISSQAISELSPADLAAIQEGSTQGVGRVLHPFALQDIVAGVAGSVAARGSQNLVRSLGGHGYAESINPGGTGRAFAGHGELRALAGETIVPEGTSITIWSAPNVRIPDGLGRAIEAGDFDAISKNPIWRDLMKGATTYLPGSKVPNYTLKAPTGLNILENSMTVEDSTPLSKLLKPNMGRLDWAGCTSCR